MPIYEYDCPKCGVMEITQRITDSPLKKCPDCKSKVSKLISLSTFSLKGSGWYVTDYGGKKTPVAAGDSGNGSNGDAKESKPDSKSKDVPSAKAAEKGSKPSSSSSKSTASAT